MKYMATIDTLERPVSCQFIGCNGNVSPYLLEETTDIKEFKENTFAPNDYQELAMRTNDGRMTERLMKAKPEYEHADIGGIIEGCLGLSGEAGELVDLIKKWVFHEKPLDEEHAKKELGDVMWYAALICESFGWKMEDVMNLNIEKLKKRYPEGFTTERANNRKENDV